MKIKIEIDEKTIKQLIVDYCNEQLGNKQIATENVKLLVRSKQNWNNKNWEDCDIIATNETGTNIIPRQEGTEIKAEIKS